MLNLVRRISGQVESIETAIEQGADCSDILHIRSAPGRDKRTQAEVLDGHIRFHVPIQTRTRHQSGRGRRKNRSTDSERICGNGYAGIKG
jgi:DNA-binding FrmR family transcriptional regulator